MKKYAIKLSLDLITDLLTGKKLIHNFGGEIEVTILPPIEGLFLTQSEVAEILNGQLKKQW